MEEPGFTHAGAVVYRDDDGRREYLVVRSSDWTSWVLAKGHIESAETPEEAACREVLEEAGVQVEIVRFLRGLSIPAKKAHVAFFLARSIGEGKAAEKRERRWLEPNAAAALLSFDDTRKLLLEAAADGD